MDVKNHPLSMGRFDWLEIPDFDEDKREKIKEDTPRQPAETDNYDSQYYLQLAAVQYLDGDFDSALKHFSRALHLDRDNAAAWAGQVKALIGMNELNEAKIWVEKAISIFPKDGELLAAKASLLCKSELHDDALACSDNSIQQSGEFSYIWLVRGEIFLSLNRHDLARHCFDKAKGLENAEADILFEIGQAYFNRALFIQACEYFNRSLEKQPSNPFRWFKLARAYEKLYWLQKAEFSYRKALELESDFKQAKTGLEELNKKKGDFFYSLKSFFKNILASR
ncbi:MAG: tetratricopeptide repeat protein [Candidatus Omnitrophota bacterium]